MIKISNVLYPKIKSEVEKYIDYLIDILDLQQINDPIVIRENIEQILNDNPKLIDEYISGNKKVYNKIVGQAMKLHNGKLNPTIVNEILTELLDLKSSE